MPRTYSQTCASGFGIDPEARGHALAIIQAGDRLLIELGFGLRAPWRVSS